MSTLCKLEVTLTFALFWFLLFQIQNGVQQMSLEQRAEYIWFTPKDILQKQLLTYSDTQISCKRADYIEYSYPYRVVFKFLQTFGDTPPPIINIAFFSLLELTLRL